MQRISGFILGLSFLLAWNTTKAQQNIQFTQSMFDRIYFNPAVAGSEGAACISALHRSQWVGLEGAPSSQNVNFHLPLGKLGGGLGLSLVNDRIGFAQNNEVKIAYAYQRPLFGGRFSIGISAGVDMKGYIDPSWETPDGSDPSLDDAIPVSGDKAIRPDVGVGVYYDGGVWFAGVSMQNGLANKLEFNGGLTFEEERHYYLVGGYSFDLTRDIQLQPYLMLKTDASSFTQADIAVRGLYDNRYWAGLAYRSQDAISILLGMSISDNFRFGYSYDLNTSVLRRSNSGGHEIMVTYCFVIDKKSPGIKNERYRNIRFL